MPRTHRRNGSRCYRQHPDLTARFAEPSAVGSLRSDASAAIASAAVASLCQQADASLYSRCGAKVATVTVATDASAADAMAADASEASASEALAAIASGEPGTLG